MCALQSFFIVSFFYINPLHFFAPPTPLPTCFWLKAWAEPSDRGSALRKGMERFLQPMGEGRTGPRHSGQWAKGEQGRGTSANGRPECREL